MGSKNIKRILKIFLLTALILCQNSYCLAEDSTGDQDAAKLEYQFNKNEESLHNMFQGQVQYDEGLTGENTFTGAIEEVKQGARLKMTVASVISSGLSYKGDEFFAEVTDDFSTQGGIVIPSGTVAHGTVMQLENSKRLGRDGYISVNFDYLITPDGRKIPIEASMTTKRHPASAAAKVVLEDTAYTMAGGVIGGLLALKFFGLGAAVASKGGTVAGGAGIGATVGLTASLVRKGQDVLIAPGDEIKVRIVESLDMPVYSDEALRDKDLFLDGLDVKVISYTLENDPFGDLNTITLALDIKNLSDKSFSTFDIALVNEYKRTYYASPFGDTGMWFQKITPGTRMKGMMSFSVDSPKKKHWLVFYDSRTRKPVAKFSLKNVERELKKEARK